MASFEKQYVDKGTQTSSGDFDLRDVIALSPQLIQSTTAQNEAVQKDQPEQALTTNSAKSSSSESVAKTSGYDVGTSVLHSDGARPAYNSWMRAIDDCVSNMNHVTKVDTFTEHLMYQMNRFVEGKLQELRVEKEFKRVLRQQHPSTRLEFLQNEKDVPNVDFEPTLGDRNYVYNLTWHYFAGDIVHDVYARFMSAVDDPMKEIMRRATRVPSPSNRSEMTTSQFNKTEKRSHEEPRGNSKTAVELLTLLERGEQTSKLNAQGYLVKTSKIASYCDWCLQLNRIIDDIVRHNDTQTEKSNKPHKDYVAFARSLRPDYQERMAAIRLAKALEVAVKHPEIVEHFATMPTVEWKHSCMLEDDCPVFRITARASIAKSSKPIAFAAKASTRRVSRKKVKRTGVNIEGIDVKGVNRKTS